MERIHTLPTLPVRPREGHKGVFGRVLVVGGGATMVGAPVLAGTAALRTGAGLVQIAVPREILAASLSITPELIGLALSALADGAVFNAAIRSADAIVIGPGMGQSSAGAKRLKKLIAMDVRLVVDADALNLLADGKRWPAEFKARAVLTPHPGEMERLAKLLKPSFKGETMPKDDTGRISLAAAAAREFRQIVVLKGARTIVTDAKRFFVNQTGDSSLSKAGTGDVLTGVLATLLAQSIEPFEAACIAVHLHGLAGEIAGKRFGMRSVLARDVIDAIPEALRSYEGKHG